MITDKSNFKERKEQNNNLKVYSYKGLHPSSVPFIKIEFKDLLVRSQVFFNGYTNFFSIFCKSFYKIL